jgi:L-lactate dehydrogenase
VKLGIIGAGNVGAAIAMAAASRARLRKIVLVDQNAARARAVATDIHYGAALSPLVTVCAGDYPGLADAGLVMIAAGVNEKRAAPPTAATRPAGCACWRPTQKSTAISCPGW